MCLDKNKIHNVSWETKLIAKNGKKNTKMKKIDGGRISLLQKVLFINLSERINIKCMIGI